MADDNNAYARVFPVETNFQRMACRPGGVPREQALRNAKIHVLRLFIRSRETVGYDRNGPIHALPLRHPRNNGYLAMAWASSVTK
jgi:hypothetical protein